MRQGCGLVTDVLGKPFSFTALIKVLKKKEDPTLNYSFIVLLTALRMAHGKTHRWRDGSANRLECTKKRISLQNTHVPLHYDPLPEMPFLTVPMSRNSTTSENLYQISWLWSTQNHLAGAG